MLTPPDGRYTADQAAIVLEVPASTIRRWRREGQAAAAGQLSSRGRGGVAWLFYLDELRPLADAYHAHRHAARRLKPVSSGRA